MAFTFTFQIDYTKLNKMMDDFLKQHTKELTSMVGQCLVIAGSDEATNNLVTNLQNTPKQEPNATVDNRPLISDIPGDPFANMFPNPNANTTRSGDRK